jgi:hypothetical protein
MNHERLASIATVTFRIRRSSMLVFIVPSACDPVAQIGAATGARRQAAMNTSLLLSTGRSWGSKAAAATLEREGASAGRTRSILWREHARFQATQLFR